MALCAVLVIMFLGGAVQSLLAESGVTPAFSSASGIASAIGLIIALNRFFLSSRFELGPAGVSAEFPFARRQLRWEEVRRIEIGSWAAWFSTSPVRLPRESRDGVHVLFGQRAADVRGWLARHGVEHCEAIAKRLAEKAGDIGRDAH